MKLKIETRKTINCSAWDNLITESYGKPYDFQQQDGRYRTCHFQPLDDSKSATVTLGGDIISTSFWGNNVKIVYK